MSERVQSVVAVLIGIALASAAQVLMKQGLGQFGALQLGSGLGGKVIKMVTSPKIVSGLAMYGLSSVFYLFALSREDLSFVYPLLALNFVLIAVLSRYVLGETLGTPRVAGIGIVAVGVALISVKS